jgi:hypothetical protein
MNISGICHILHNNPRIILAQTGLTMLLSSSKITPLNQSSSGSGPKKNAEKTKKRGSARKVSETLTFCELGLKNDIIKTEVTKRMGIIEKPKKTDQKEFPNLKRRLKYFFILFLSLPTTK